MRPCVEGVFVFDYWALDGESQPSGPRKGTLRRTVAARFPEGSTAAEREAVYAGGDSFAQIMEGRCASYEWGINNSPEGKDLRFMHCSPWDFTLKAMNCIPKTVDLYAGKELGFTHCFTLGFEDEAQREAWTNAEGMSAALEAFHGRHPDLEEVLLFETVTD